MPVDGLASWTDAAALPELAAGADVVLEGVEILHLFFEVPSDIVRRALPRALHPTIPGAAYLTFLRCPSTPWGPVTLAEVRLAARLREKPRALLHAAVIDAAPAARVALADGWGLAASPGAVRLRRWYDRIEGVASVDGAEVAHGELADAEPIHGATLQYGPFANPVRVGGSPGVALVDPVMVLGDDRERGRLRVRTLDGSRLGLAGLRPTAPIGAYYATADLRLPPPTSVLDPAIARGGSARAVGG